MLNIFVGYEQNNKYAISMSALCYRVISAGNVSCLANLDGEPLGYIVEEQGSIASVMSRQLLRTHRPFKALILDLHGSTILWVKLPHSFTFSF